ncbi:MAG TPA: hypothetical protein VML55_07540, partial [Planctomycetaceae bacterium]|nr:hypothetical protein [Planctomycetaceae bacterium]
MLAKLFTYSLFGIEAKPVDSAKRALTVADSGGHHIGSPGKGPKGAKGGKEGGKGDAARMARETPLTSTVRSGFVIRP